MIEELKKDGLKAINKATIGVVRTGLKHLFDVYEYLPKSDKLYSEEKLAFHKQTYDRMMNVLDEMEAKNK